MGIKRFLLLMPFFVLLSCGSGDWTADDESRFLDACAEEGGGSSYCRCYLDHVIEHYPNPSDAEQMDFETAVELADKCE